MYVLIVPQSFRCYCLCECLLDLQWDVWIGTSALPWWHPLPYVSLFVASSGPATPAAPHEAFYHSLTGLEKRSLSICVSLSLPVPLFLSPGCQGKEGWRCLFLAWDKADLSNGFTKWGMQLQRLKWSRGQTERDEFTLLFWLPLMMLSTTLITVFKFHSQALMTNVGHAAHLAWLAERPVRF